MFICDILKIFNTDQYGVIDNEQIFICIADVRRFNAA